MDALSLSQLTQQINQQENLSERLLEAEALAEVTVMTEFVDLSKTTVHQYLATLSKLVVQSRELSEKVLDALCELRSSIKNSLP